AFEMLTQDQQREVDEAMRQADGAAALDARLRWRERGWPDFGMYQPLFELALRFRLPVMAADLDPGTVRRIAKEGLGVLPEIERAQLASRLRPDPEREARLEREIAEAHCGLLPAAAIPFMVQAWHTRNLVMARRIGQALDEGRRVVVIVGRGHLERGGLPDQLNALRPGTLQLVVEFVEAPLDESAPPPGPSSIRWLTPRVERGDPCAQLRRPR
ncbi:MAG TPA: ChaN family lipoprotein, partial [Verrucomicrobiae bacterium]|nr:ChaN family lipoprotein [Verrucomicrobiae bacterium]